MATSYRGSTAVSNYNIRTIDLLSGPRGYVVVRNLFPTNTYTLGVQVAGGDVPTNEPQRRGARLMIGI